MDVNSSDTAVVRTPRALRLSVILVAVLTSVAVVAAPLGAKLVAVAVGVWWGRMATCWARSDRSHLRIRNSFGSRTIPWADVDGWVVRPGHVDVVVAGRPVTVEALSRTGLGRGAQAKGEAAVRVLTGPRRTEVGT